MYIWKVQGAKLFKTIVVSFFSIMIWLDFFTFTLCDEKPELEPTQSLAAPPFRFFYFFTFITSELDWAHGTYIRR